MDIKAGVIIIDYGKDIVYAGRLKDSLGNYSQNPVFTQGNDVVEPDSLAFNIKTKNILFICGGAFDGIERKIGQRLNTQVVGYAASKEKDQIDAKNLLQYIAPQELKSFGLIPEIIGRLPVLTYLNPLKNLENQFQIFHKDL